MFGTKRNAGKIFVIVPMLIVVMLNGFAATALAEFTIVSNSAVFDPLNQSVLFTLEFSEPPDFLTVDPFGRQTDSFQYYIVGDPNLPYPQFYDTIIRGEEIHITRDTIRVRNAFPPALDDPNSGDWGSIRGTVPFTLSGSIVTFLAPLSMISDHSIDGHFSYDLGSFVLGDQTDFLHGESTILAVGQPGTPHCIHTSVLELRKQYGSLDAAASALGFSDAKALKTTILTFCRR